MKIKLICLLMSCGFLMFIISGCNVPIDTLKTEVSEEQGNTNGNIHNLGLLLVNNEWIYYTNIDDNNHLYKKRLDGSEKAVLVKGHYAYNLNLINDNIYYLSSMPGKIYRVDINGKKGKVIVDKKVENLIVTNENIFYRESFDNNWGKMYRTDLEGKNEVLLANNVIEFAISDGWLYYSNRDDNGYLYKMDLDGKNITKLTNQYTSDINVLDDYVYYTDYNDGQKLYRIKNDGTEKCLLSNDTCWEVNVYNDYIYYRNQTNKGKIYRMKCDGSDNNVIIEKENCVNINVVDDFLIYCVPQSTGGYFKTNLDGNNIEKWAEKF